MDKNKNTAFNSLRKIQGSEVTDNKIFEEHYIFNRGRAGDVDGGMIESYIRRME